MKLFSVPAPQPHPLPVPVPQPPVTIVDRLVRALHITTRVNSARNMQVLETLSLGSHRQVNLILCNGRQYLVGCGPDQVTTIVPVSSTSDSEPMCP